MKHLARIGGVLVRPRHTLLSIAMGQGGQLWELLPWIAIAAATAAPIEAGRAILLMRADVVAGLGSFAALIGDRIGAGLAGAAIGAAILSAVSAKRIPFDRAFDACLFMLVPWMLAASVGSALSELGVELWFMPHRRIRGDGWILTARILAAYGWSITLFVVVAVALRRSRG